MPKKKKHLPDLSKAEHEILRVLWRKDEATIRQVHDQLAESTGWAYTTTKTHMDRMVKRALLARTKKEGGFWYFALVSRPEGLARMVKYFSERVLELNFNAVVSMFAKSDALTKKEVEELKRMVEQLDD